MLLSAASAARKDEAACPSSRRRLALLISSALAVSLLFLAQAPDAGRIGRALVSTTSLAQQQQLPRGGAAKMCSSTPSLRGQRHTGLFSPHPLQQRQQQQVLLGDNARSMAVFSSTDDVTSKSILLRAEELTKDLELEQTESNKRRCLSGMGEADLSGRVVLVRADLNVPLAPMHDEVLLDQRLKDAIPTIRYLTQRGAKVLVIGHIERLREDGPQPVSLAPVASAMSELMNEVVTFVAESTGPKVEKVVETMGMGTVVLLENVRLNDPELDEKNDEEFARKLASVADIFVMDDFADAHLNLASTVGVTKYCEINVAGLLVESEHKHLEEAVNKPERPFAAVVGGAKLSEKFEMINRLLDKVDGIFIGGGIANTFLKARGMQIADSLAEDEYLNHARRLELKARNKGIKLIFPDDFLFADTYSVKALTSILPYSELGEKGRVPAGWMVLDHGDLSVLNIVTQFKSARTFFWNGPIGAEELDNFAYGSHAVAALASAIGAMNRTSIVGGRDTVAALDRANMRKDTTHVSTGGASFYDMMEGKILPGISSLDPPDEVKVDIPQLTGDAPLFDVDAMD
uniref:Phosphoglycerate kinase n=1 Tax=Bigelowiella natans TaxID=227086 RepID=Q7XYJ8_BIGNA|nr:phosphoglycerate kinase 2 [Bigelowiella natans]|mmetsp:Transcript_9964/g.13835  ORF Transcript_9964/g.13835 Transcript_9964/m.13835 type:complete len:575 (-) Transcript_9964:219-1943(-)